MRRTAIHLHSSPNPAQLEMRILANHGADKRFAFLRGRWSRAWRLVKIRLQTETTTKETERKKEEQSGGTLGALAGYGDSDEDGSHCEGAEPPEIIEDGSLDTRAREGGVPSDPGTERDEVSVKEARRARAKLWAEPRRLARPSSPSNDQGE